MSVENIAWVLPRPSKSKYKGSFPLHFEKKLLGLLGNPPIILQPFGGSGETGIICDVKLDNHPSVICDAHFLPFKSNSFDLVLSDPPYSDEESKDIYSTSKLRPLTFIREASRVCKPHGFVALYHKLMLPRPPQTIFSKRVFVGTRVWHLARICGVFQKYPCSHNNNDQDCQECFTAFKEQSCQREHSKVG